MPRILPIRSLSIALALGALTGPASAAGQNTALLARVQIPGRVMAGGAPLPPGTYELRLTDERPALLPGQPRDTQRVVEFVANGRVVARETAEVLRDDDRPAVGASAALEPEGTRVDVLRGGEFLRVSVKRDQVRYLVHLPLAGQG